MLRAHDFPAPSTACNLHGMPAPGARLHLLLDSADG
jgi:hypothetical protein